MTWASVFPWNVSWRKSKRVEYSSGGDCNTITKLIGKTMFLASVHHSTFTRLPRAEVSTDGHDMNEVTALRCLARLRYAFNSIEQIFVMCPTQRVHMTILLNEALLTHYIHTPRVKPQLSQRIIWGHSLYWQMGKLSYPVSGVPERNGSTVNTVWIRLDAFNCTSRSLNHNVPKNCHKTSTLLATYRTIYQGLLFAFLKGTKHSLDENFYAKFLIVEYTVLYKIFRNTVFIIKWKCYQNNTFFV